jgi:hypothetical protein
MYVQQSKGSRKAFYKSETDFHEFFLVIYFMCVYVFVFYYCHFFPVYFSKKKHDTNELDN